MQTPKPLTEQDFTAAARLREALRGFQRHGDQASSAQGLTSRTYQLLLMIKTARSGNGRSSLRELEQRLQLGKSTVTELVLRTEKRGFVRRQLDLERPGAIFVELTAAGERKLADVVTELGDERRRLIDTLSKLR